MEINKKYIKNTKISIRDIFKLLIQTILGILVFLLFIYSSINFAIFQSVGNATDSSSKYALELLCNEYDTALRNNTTIPSQEYINQFYTDKFNKFYNSTGRIKDYKVILDNERHTINVKTSVEYNVLGFTKEYISYRSIGSSLYYDRRIHSKFDR